MINSTTYLIKGWKVTGDKADDIYEKLNEICEEEYNSDICDILDGFHNILLLRSEYIIAKVPKRKLIIINIWLAGPDSSMRCPAAVPGHSAEAARPKARPGSLGSSLCSSHSVTGMERFSRN